jgi:hypothetical protein
MTKNIGFAYKLEVDITLEQMKNMNGKNACEDRNELLKILPK